MTIRKYSLLLFGAAFIAGAIGCTKETDTESAAEAETAAVSEPVSGWTVDDLAAALSDPGRAEADRARDAGRMPAEVVVFLGIEHGMTALDLIAAGGVLHGSAFCSSRTVRKGDRSESADRSPNEGRCQRKSDVSAAR